MIDPHRPGLVVESARRDLSLLPSVEIVPNSPRAVAPLTIEKLAREQVPAVAKVLARSFQEDPFTAFLFPDPVKRAFYLPLAFRPLVQDTLQFDGSFVALDANRQVKGASVWLPPNAYPMSTGRFIPGLRDHLT